MATTGRVKTNATRTSTAVVTPSVNAKPRTLPMLRMYSTTAPSRDTKSAANRVRRARNQPVSAATRSGRPSRTSSRTRAWRSGWVASEYTAGAQTVGSARQVSTTMLVQPRRGTVVAAKVVVVLGLTVVLTAVASALTFQVTQHALGAWSPSFSPVPWGRLAGLLTWWALTALGAMALAALTRGALVPLVWGITTSSLVSPSFLLSKVTDLAAYLPDAAAWNLFMKDTSLLAAGPGTGAAALTCAAWAVLALVVTSVCWVRRDA